MRLLTASTFLLFGYCYAGLIGRDDHSSGEDEECHFEYFTQNIDHSGQHNGTFAQRYSVNTEYYEPGGPIFWMQGSEGAELECVVSIIRNLT